MNKKPIKIIFDDGSEEDCDDLLEYVDDSDIEHYAEWYLDMKSEDELKDEREIDDFSDDEILDELLFRYKIHKDIISMQKIKDFFNNFYNN